MRQKHRFKRWLQLHLNDETAARVLRDVQTLEAHYDLDTTNISAQYVADYLYDMTTYRSDLPQVKDNTVDNNAHPAFTGRHPTYVATLMNSLRWFARFCGIDDLQIEQRVSHTRTRTHLIDQSTIITQLLDHTHTLWVISTIYTFLSDHSQYMWRQLQPPINYVNHADQPYFELLLRFGAGICLSTIQLTHLVAPSAKDVYVDWADPDTRFTVDQLYTIFGHHNIQQMAKLVIVDSNQYSIITTIDTIDQRYKLLFQPVQPSTIGRYLHRLATLHENTPYVFTNPSHTGKWLRCTETIKQYVQDHIPILLDALELHQHSNYVQSSKVLLLVLDSLRHRHSQHHLDTYRLFNEGSRLGLGFVTADGHSKYYSNIQWLDNLYRAYTAWYPILGITGSDHPVQYHLPQLMLAI